jgi:cytochrome c1
MTYRTLLSLAAGALLATFSRSVATQAAAPQPWQPGLGEFMQSIQHHHAALFCAGTNGNWELASYELKELEETFTDARTYTPRHDGLAVKELIESIVPPATKQLHQSIEKGDKNLFAEGFKTLTVGCNACHTASKVPFLRIIEPTGIPTVNQSYERK